eukprot:c13275_g1_i1.p1 GENE.c13275_g1_i1~~c13275_g1_i1.p1  ORF type:complete len:245 (-),score=88.47 c13275_g1_i1:125-859(-)
MSAPQDPSRNAKRAAARRAVDLNVKDGMVVGVGTGSTAAFVVERLGELVHSGWGLVCIPTSHQSRQLIIENKLHLGALDTHPHMDVVIDGCDESDSHLNLIKGGGGALMQEKIVAYFATKFVVVADHHKESTVLGQHWKAGVPVEVCPFAYVAVQQHIASQLAGVPHLRMAVRKAGPVVTDNGNFILDVDFGEIADPQGLAVKLQAIPGVLEHGLFCDMAFVGYFGRDDGTVVARYADGKVDNV